MNVALQPPSKKLKSTPLAMASAGKHPRGNRFPPLIPEFCNQLDALAPPGVDVTINQTLTQQQCHALQVPFPAKGGTSF